MDTVRRKALAIAVSICLACAVQLATAATESEVSVEAPASARPGDPFTVNITVDPEEPLGGMQCGIVFNGSVLEARQVEDNGLFDIWLNSSLEIDNENGSIGPLLGVNLNQSVTNSTGVFARIIFNATDEGKGWIRLVNITLSDPGGNESLPYASTNDTVIIENDTRAPALSYTLFPPEPDGQNDWYVGPVEVNVTAQDEHGVKNVSWQINNDGWHTVSANNTTFTVSMDGDHNIGLKATDLFGNTNTTSFPLQVDSTPPTADITLIGTEIGNGVYEDNVTIHLTADDAPSDIDSIYYNVDDTSWKTYENDFTVTEKGNHTARYYAVDMAGNTGENKTESFEIINNTDPIANFSYHPSSPTTQDTVQFTNESIDPDDSIVNWTWDMDDGTMLYSENVTHSYGDNGTYNVMLTVEDNDGATDSVSQNVTVTNVGPAADFTVEPSSPSTDDTIYFNSTSSDSDGSIVNWAWDMGDHTTLYGEEVTHSYSDGGNYTVNLTITDDDGATNTSGSPITVAVNAPPRQPSNPFPGDGATDVGTSPTLSVDVSDSDGDSMTVTFYDDSDDSLIGTDTGVADGGRASVTWNGRAYSTTYSWYAVADDGRNTNMSQTWSFTTQQPPSPEPQPPTAAFSYSVDGRNVSFTDESSDDGSITSRQWTFGDDTSGNGQQVQHSYDGTGNYTVTLTVTDDEGESDSVYQVVFINGPPVASFDAPDNATVSSLVNFTDHSSDSTGSIVTYTWRFGDGSQGHERNASHVYTEAGAYTVTLQVRDSYNATDSVSHHITIKPGYEFSVTSIDYAASLFGADDVTVSVTNTGGERAEDVPCTISIDKKVIETKKIGVAPAGGTATLSFTVDLAPLRGHTIRAVVDPNDNFPEGNDNNNALRIDVPVNWLLVALIAAAAAAIVGSIVLLLRRRKPVEEPHHRRVTVQDGQQIQRCLVCRGKLKADAAAVHCECGNIFHQSCAKRVGVCPDCRRELVSGQGEQVEDAGQASDGEE